MKQSVVKVHRWIARRPSWQLWAVWLVGLLSVCAPTPHSVWWAAGTTLLFGAGTYALIVVNMRSDDE